MIETKREKERRREARADNILFYVGVAAILIGIIGTAYLLLDGFGVI